MESKPTPNIYTALLEAQKAFGPVLKNATNPAFKSKYADLGAVIETVAETLNNNGILFIQPLMVAQDGIQHIVTVMHHVESDTKIESSFKVVCKDLDDPQKVGGAITYGRRYSLLSFLGLAPEDDDGNSASTASTTPRATTAPATNTQTGEVMDNPETTADGECSACGRHVPGKSVYWSNKKFNRTLCWDDQKKAESGELGDPNNDIPVGDADQELDSLFKQAVS